MEDLIVKLHNRIDILKQVKIVSTIISGCLIILFFNVLGKEKSIDLILNYINPNVYIYIGLIFLSIIGIFFIERIKEVLKRVKITIFNVFLLNIGITFSIFSVISKEDLSSNFHSSYIFLFSFIMLFFVFYLKEIFKVIKINKEELSK